VKPLDSEQGGRYGGSDRCPGAQLTDQDDESRRYRCCHERRRHKKRGIESLEDVVGLDSTRPRRIGSRNEGEGEKSGEDRRPSNPEGERPR
jgi:hypothetical protein